MSILTFGARTRSGRTRTTGFNAKISACIASSPRRAVAELKLESHGWRYSFSSPCESGDMLAWTSRVLL